MPTFQINPAGSYLADTSKDPASPPTTVLLSAFAAQAGSIITLSNSGTYRAGQGVAFLDASDSLLAVFVDASGNPVAPEVFGAFTTSVQTSGLATDIAQDFFVVAGGLTQVKAPVGAVALKFSVNDGFFSDNTDLNKDFKVTLAVQGTSISYEGADSIAGTLGPDTLSAGAGRDTLLGGAGDDTLDGGLGNDILVGHLGNDRINGAGGIDTLVLSGKLTDYTVQRDPRTGEFRITDSTPQRDGVDLVRNVERFEFSNAIRSAAELAGGLSADTTAPTVTNVTPSNGALRVAPGADIVAVFSESIRRGTGEITLLRGDGTVVEIFDAASSRKISIDGNTITLNPTLRLFPGTRYSIDAPASAFTDLAGNFDPTAKLALSFTTRGSILTGSKLADILTGGADEDDLDGDEGDDVLDGGDGDDFLRGGIGNNSLKGGAGSDSALYTSAIGPVAVNLALGTATGTALNDALASIENVEGSAFADALTGDATDNTLSGASGDDGLLGGAGRDTLDGGQGADRLEGGAGDDVYAVDDAGDLVLEFDDAVPATGTPGSGLGLDLGSVGDTVNASISYVLPLSVENLLLVELAGTLSGTGNASANTLVGNESNNTLTGAGGNDIIDGGEGIDTALYTSARATYTLTRLDTGWTVTSLGGVDGVDTLTNTERLQFFDSKIALDLATTESAGQAVEFVGLLAPTLIGDPTVVGSVLGVFDEGMTLLEVCQLAIDIGLVTAFAGADTNEALAAMAYRNVVGAAPSAGDINLLVAYMDGRSASYGQADFMAVVAALDVNQTHIGLVGLQQTGVGFV